MEQRHSSHKVWRAARYCSGGVSNSRNRIGTLTPTEKLQYEEIIAGIKYDTSQGKIKQQRRLNRGKNSDSNNTKEGSDNDDKENPEIERQEHQQAEQDTSCWFVQRLGNMPQDRPEGVFQLLGRNLNNALSCDVRDCKISDILRLIETWDVQCGGFSEVGIEWRNISCSNQLNSWFCSGTDMYCTLAANNHQEYVPTSIRQQGGIALFVGKEVWQYISRTEKDFRDLGCWNSWAIQSDPSHRTRLVVAYQVGQAWQSGTQTIYQQHARYMSRRGILGTPRELFQADIISSITRWI